MNLRTSKNYTITKGIRNTSILLTLFMATTLLILSIVTNSTNQSLLEEAQAAPVTLTVDSTADTGDATPGDDICDDGAGNCTLRAAIEEANGDVDTDTIQFNIPVTDPNHLCYADDSTPGTVNPANEEVTTTQDACNSGSTIDPDHAFTWFRTSPVSQYLVTEQVVLDAYSQPGAQANTVSGAAATDAVLKVQVDGGVFASPVGGALFNINVGSDGSSFRGLVLSSQDVRYGFINSSVDSIVIAGNYIGTDPSGLSDAVTVTTNYGVYFSAVTNSTVGGSTASERNVIAGSSGSGGVGIYLRINATNNTISGNYVGVDKTGDTALSNDFGVLFYEGSDDNIFGGATVDERNVVSGNILDGIGISHNGGADNNHVMGNYIGTNASGSAAIPNDRYGVLVSAGSAGNIIGTDGDSTNDANEGNVVSASGVYGFVVSGSGNDNNIIAGNFIGTDATGTVDLGNTLHGVYILGGSQGNVIGTNGDGISDTEERNIISGNDNSGVHIRDIGTSNNVVAGNYIGTDITGTLDLGNTVDGFLLAVGATNNVIGTNGDGDGDAVEGNVISGNDGTGIQIVNTGTSNNTIAGNIIGANASGSTALMNGTTGVYIHADAQNNLIGTNADGTSDIEERNLVSGNSTVGGAGIAVYASNNDVYGNYVGVSADGNSAIPNHIGIAVGSGPTTGINVGGPLLVQRNIVSASLSYGIGDLGGNNKIQNNYVGTNATGTAMLGNGTIGIAAQGPNSVIGTDGDGTDDANEGNLVSGNGSHGIQVNLAGTNGARVSGNLIGTDVTGALDFGNTSNGVYVLGSANSNIIGTNGDGTSDIEERNIISGNDLNGVFISGTGTDNNIVAGNYIGTDVGGTAAIPNSGNGVTVDLGAQNSIIGVDSNGSLGEASERNVLSGNTFYGVLISASDNTTVAGNYIGTDVTGATALQNDRFGIYYINTNSGTIGTNADGVSDVLERNVISSNGSYGLYLSGTDSVSVAGNHIGTDISGTLPLGNVLDGVHFVNSVTNSIIGTNGDGVNDALERNIISANLRYGLYVRGSSGNTIAGNYIGTDINGTADIGNIQFGARIGEASTNNVIGVNGDGSAGEMNERNLISGNNTVGVYIDAVGTDNNVVAGNHIGTDVNGLLDLPNGTDGVIITSGSSGNTIGTNGDGASDTEERNIISGNGAYGIQISGSGTDSNIVAGNYIGTDVTGSSNLGNVGPGIRLAVGASSNYIGVNGDGSAGEANEYNVISGNNSYGVRVDDAVTNSNTIAGNRIGTSADGMSALGNTSHGVLLFDGSSSVVGTNSDGMSDTLERNVVASNGSHGVTIQTSDNNKVTGNYIGTDITGTADLGNSLSGVVVYLGSANNQVGSNNDGTNDLGEANLNRSNNTNGIQIQAAGNNNSILNNAVHSNTNIGIDNDSHQPNTPDLNDAGDTDTGSNDGLNYPIILNNSPSHPNYPIATTNPAIDVYLDIDTTETTNFLVQLYDNPSGIDASGHGEGEVFIGNANVTAAPGGITTTLNFTGTISDPANIALTITEDLGGGNYGSTSEFSSPHAQGLSGRVFNDFFYDSDDDGQAIDNGYNNVTLDIYHDDGDDIFDSLTDRLVNQVTTANNAANGGEDGEYNALVSSAGDFWVHNTDTSAVIPVTLNPAGPNIEAASTTPATTGDWTVPFGDLTQVSFGYGETLPDADGDNTPTIIEDAGPNSGDANNDGTLDSQQANVASAPNTNSPSYNASGSTPEEQSYTALALNTAGSTCDTIDNLGFVTEASLTNQDTDYDYPIGLIDFTLTCSTNGDTASITYILDTNYDTTDWVWRKYNPITNQYQDMSSSVTFGTTTIAGTTKTTATFQVTDGQNLDDDALANGTILDPSGPAVQVEGLSETGSTTAYMAPLLGTTLAISAGGVGLRIRRKRQIRL